MGHLLVLAILPHGTVFVETADTLQLTGTEDAYIEASCLFRTQSVGKKVGAEDSTINKLMHIKLLTSLFSFPTIGKFWMSLTDIMPEGAPSSK